MDDRAWRIEEGEGQLIGAAIHSGHAVRPDVEEELALAPAERLREEDPFTDQWTSVGGTTIVGLRSRFEFDLNRPPEKAVYLKPEDAWGLEIWKHGPMPTQIDRSLHLYDDFYADVARVLDKKDGPFIVYDLHSYNHRRGGPDAAPDEPELNPEVNIGTATMDRDLWAPVVDALIHTLRTVDFMGRKLDVRENVKFFGGYFSEWIHTNYPGTGCAPAIEFKKFFMDEWTGEPDEEVLLAIRNILKQTVEPVLEALHELKRSEAI